MGATLLFTASAVNGANSSISATFTYALTPTSPPGVLSVSPSGFACAGDWNAPYYSVCTPGASGVVQVTASALGQTSPPTYVFVHPPVASIQISVVPPVNAPPAACPTQIALPAACHKTFTPTNSCLSQNQIQTLQATAFDAYGNDITALVGPFTWTEATTGVATVTPIVTNTVLNVPTNQATASPNTPGQTAIIAAAAGVSGQPYYFETCPVQCINLNVSASGEYTGQTSFVASVKGGTEIITATAVDVQGCIVPKPPLTWTSSQPAAVAAGSATAGCAAGITCSLTLKQPGAAAITASCTPPTCNIGFPLNPAGLPAPFVPQPVYPVTAISGLVTGTTSAASVLATSQDCSSNSLCTVALYDVSTAKNLAANPNSLPNPPNSLMFDPAGDKAYLGSQYGAALVTTSSLGSSSSNPFSALPAAGTPLNLVTGRILAVSPTGNQAIFSDTVSIPNQVYVVSTASGASSIPENINSAIAAAFSPDSLEAYILGDGGNTLYTYSTLLGLQTYPPLTAAANAVAFSSSGAFAVLAGGSSTSNISIYNTCNNSPVNLPITGLPGAPTFLKMVPPGNFPITGVDPAGLDVYVGLDNIGTQDTGLDILVTNASQGPFATTLCPQGLALPATFTLASTPVTNPLHIDLQYGHFHPINFFLSPDATRVYIVTTDFGVLVYSFDTQSVTAAIPLNGTGNPAPIAADMTVDGTLIYVAGTDNLLHEVNTLQAQDVMEIPFFDLPNSSNEFCYSSFTCALNMVAIEP